MLTHGDMQSWLDTVWDALDQENRSAEQWDEICTAMAWISETLLPDVVED